MTRNQHKILILTNLIIVFLVNPLVLFAQSVSIFDIDVSEYPDVKAKVYFVNQAGEFVTDINSEDITLLEHSTNINPELNCKFTGEPVAISSVLTIDISGSMEGERLNFAKLAALGWISALPLDNSECAITSFNDLNYLNQDFTQDYLSLKNAIEGLTADGGTDYNKAFLDEPAGALPICEKGRNKRIVVFITDGVSHGNEAEIISMAKSLSASVYSVVIGFEAPDILKRISKSTGGRWFGEINTPEEFKMAFDIILQDAQELEPCVMRWKSSGCAIDRDLITMVQAGNFSAMGAVAYKVPKRFLRDLIIEPSASLDFGKVSPDNDYYYDFTISAVNDSIEIQEITTTNPDFRISGYGGMPPPFYLAPGESRDLEIMFQAKATSLPFGNISIVSDACFTKNILLSGIIEGAPVSENIKMEWPDGGEKLVAGSDTTIQWSGLLPGDTVSLEYSTDGGSQWQLVNENAAGLNYLWRVPQTESNLCLMKVRSIDKAAGKVLFLTGHNDNVYTLAWSPDATEIISGGPEGRIFLWNAETGKIKSLISDSEGTIASLAWSPDGSVFLSNYNENIKVWDAVSGELLKELEGHNSTVLTIQWSPDGRHFASGCSDGEMIVWDAVDFSVFERYKAHDKALSSLDWAADGTEIASGSWDRTFRIISFPEMTTKERSDDFGFEIYSVDIDPEDKFLAVGGRSAEVHIWDILNSLYTDTLQTRSESVWDVSWSPDRKYLATGTSRGSLILWNALNRDSVYEYSGHTTDLKTIGWSFSGRKIATGSDDTFIEIWSPEDIPFERTFVQEDESDGIWSIVSPKFKSKDADLGTALIGETKDVIISEFLYNNGPVPIRIDSIKITGATAGQFDLVVERYPLFLSQGEKRSVEFKFMPALPEGIKSAKVEIYTQTEKIVQNLSGNAIEKKIEILSSLIDFGRVQVEDKKDSSFTALRNIGSAPLMIESVEFTGTQNGHFTILEGGDNFMLMPGAEHDMKVRFEPDLPERFNTNIRFNLRDEEEAPVVQLFGEGIDYELLVERSVNYEIQICEPENIDTVITIENIGTEEITISSATIVSDTAKAFSIVDDVDGQKISGNSSLDLTISFSPKFPGTKTAKLLINSYIIAEAEKQSEVNLAGSFEVYEFELSDDTVDFGLLEENTPASASFTIRNTGTLPLVWPDMPVAVDKFTIVEIIPDTTRAGDSSIAKVTFAGAPQSTTHDSQYTFTDDCGNLNNIRFKATVLANQPKIAYDGSVEFPLRLCETGPFSNTIIITNSGKNDLLLQNADLLHGSQTGFGIVTAVSNETVAPTNDFDIELVFDPQSYGTIYDTLLINSNAVNAEGGVTRIPVSGRNERVSLDVSTALLDFGNVPIETPASATFTIENTGTYPLDWAVPVYLDDFTVTDIDPGTTPAGGRSVASVLFEGGQPDTGYLDDFVLEDVCGNTKTVTLSAYVEAPASIILKPGTICGYPDDIVTLPILIDGAGSLLNTSHLGFRSKLEMNAGVLEPYGATPQGYVNGDLLTIDIELPPLPVRDNILAEYEFKVKRTFYDTTLIYLKDSEPLDWYVDISEESGTFVLACGNPIREPVWDECDNIILYQSFPNPSEKIITIEYEVLTNTEITFDLWNMRGQKLTTFYEGPVAEGAYSYQFDPSALASGLYIYRIVSPACTRDGNYIILIGKIEVN